MLFEWRSIVGDITAFYMAFYDRDPRDLDVMVALFFRWCDLRTRFAIETSPEVLPAFDPDDDLAFEAHCDEMRRLGVPGYD